MVTPGVGPEPPTGFSLVLLLIKSNERILGRSVCNCSVASKRDCKLAFISAVRALRRSGQCYMRSAWSRYEQRDKGADTPHDRVEYARVLFARFACTVDHKLGCKLIVLLAGH